jgi:cyclin-dependent kinase 8/11
MLLKELHHPNILRLESVQLNRADATLSLVFNSRSHLFEIIQHHKMSMRNALVHVQHFPPDMVKSIMWQLLLGLDYLHRNWIIHRDLKPSNLLLMGADSCSPGARHWCCVSGVFDDHTSCSHLILCCSAGLPNDLQ